MKSKKELHISDESDMIKLGYDFAAKITAIPTVIELIGDVGTGKTTFTRGLAKGLGITSPITSPSFTISKSYPFVRDGKTYNLIHYDFYRLDDPGIMTSDLAEAITTNSVIVIEWGESIKDILPKNHTVIKITYNDDNSRKVVFL